MSEAAFFLEELRNNGIRVREPNKQIGGNSRLYKFKTDGKRYVLKVYSGDKERIKQSREREIEALIFLRKAGFLQVPKVNLSSSPTDGVCLEFVKGKKPRQNKRTHLEIINSFRILKQIYDKSPDFVDAVDASFKTCDVIRQLEERIKFQDLWNVSQIKFALEKLKLEDPIHFPDRSLTYSFSDIGAHNMITHLGKYWFLDLEFFGRDSAVKMLNDYLLHPRNIITIETLQESIELAGNVFGVNRATLLKTTPFFALKWAAIVAKRIETDESKDQASEFGKRFDFYLDLTTVSDLNSIASKLTNLG